MALPQLLEVIPWTAPLITPSSSADAPVSIFVYTLTAQVSKLKFACAVIQISKILYINSESELASLYVFSHRGIT